MLSDKYLKILKVLRLAYCRNAARLALMADG